MDMNILDVSFVVSKFMLYIAIMLASGITLYSIIFETSEAKKLFPTSQILKISSILSLLFLFINYGIISVRLTGDLVSLLDLEIHNILIDTHIASVLLLRVLGLSLILISYFFNEKIRQIISFIGCLIILWSFSLIGHISDMTIFMKFLLFIHLITVALWVGILLPLYQLSRYTAYINTTRIIAYKFGKIAIYFVPILSIVGLIMAYQLLGSVNKILTTQYGQLMLLKIIAVLGLLALAAMNKFCFVPNIMASNCYHLKYFQKSLLLEMTCVIVIFTITAILTSSVNLP